MKTFEASFSSHEATFESLLNFTLNTDSQYTDPLHICTDQLQHWDVCTRRSAIVTYFVERKDVLYTSDSSI